MFRCTWNMLTWIWISVQHFAAICSAFRALCGLIYFIQLNLPRVWSWIFEILYSRDVIIRRALLVGSLKPDRYFRNINISRYHIGVRNQNPTGIRTANRPRRIRIGVVISTVNWCRTESRERQELTFWVFVLGQSEFLLTAFYFPH